MKFNGVQRTTFGLRNLMIGVATVCAVLSVYRVVPRDLQKWMIVAGPFFALIGALGGTIHSPRRLMIAFACAQAIFVFVCLAWASMASDGIARHARFTPVEWPNMHLLLLWSYFGLPHTFIGWVGFSILATAWWAAVGYALGFMKRSLQRMHR